MKKTQEEFVKEVSDKLGSSYKIVSEYTGNKNPVNIIHLSCGTTYSTKPVNILFKGWKCKKCFGISLTTDRFKEKIDEIFGKGEYVILEEYKGTSQKIKVQHTVCGRIWEANPKTLLRGCKCKLCSAKSVGKTQAKSREKFCQELLAKRGSNYILISNYVSSLTKVKIKHIPCNSSYLVRPDSILAGAECPVCLANRYSNEYRKTTQEYGDEISKSTFGEYELVSSYAGVKKPIKVRHLSCNNVYKTYPYLFNRGRRCPRCKSMSTGELMIERYLKENNIAYVRQVKFNDCIDTNKLSYDFLLPMFNTLIEYQGEQHYKPIALFGGLPTFITQVKHDSIKEKYANNRDYKLLKISYKRHSYKSISNTLDIYLSCVKQRDSYLNLSPRYSPIP